MYYNRYRLGNDNCVYVVFANEESAEEYYSRYGGTICCFDGYYNAVCVQELWGM